MFLFSWSTVTVILIKEIAAGMIQTEVAIKYRLFKLFNAFYLKKGFEESANSRTSDLIKTHETATFNNSDVTILKWLLKREF